MVSSNSNDSVVLRKDSCFNLYGGKKKTTKINNNNKTIGMTIEHVGSKTKLKSGNFVFQENSFFVHSYSCCEPQGTLAMCYLVP